MKVLSGREASIFACLCDTLLAPAPPLPPVCETDAVASFDRWLALAPALNRLALRATLLALEVAPRLTQRRRFRRLSRSQRLAFLRHAGPLVEPLRATAAVSYYGDARVCALLGYEGRPA
jgi:hypothetical protein